ncbi:hypothetical protein ABFS83_05G095700 [Erythranthe nasuta]
MFSITRACFRRLSVCFCAFSACQSQLVGLHNFYPLISLSNGVHFISLFREYNNNKIGLIIHYGHSNLVLLKFQSTFITMLSFAFVQADILGNANRDYSSLLGRDDLWVYVHFFLPGVSLTDFGGVGDGTTSNTRTFQTTI